jgi:protein gp37
MAEKSNIGWTDSTLNFWLGCSKVHSGCVRCYAENLMSTRFGKVNWGLNTPRVITKNGNWNQAAKWNRESDPEKPTVVFSNSLADMFEHNTAQCVDHNKKPLWISNDGKTERWIPDTDSKWTKDLDRLRLDHVTNRAFSVIQENTDLRWVILTKRVNEIFSKLPFTAVDCESCGATGDRQDGLAVARKNASGVVNFDSTCVVCQGLKKVKSFNPLPHVWLCFSVSEQAHYDQLMTEFRPQIETLRPIFGGLGLSVEPQIGPITLDIMKHSGHSSYPFQWIKQGGESGAGARPFDLAWAESMLLECDPHEDIMYFFKQAGENPIRTVAGTVMPYLNMADDKKGERLDNMPLKVRLRQSPFKQEVRDPECIRSIEA